jgi:glycosyltransferase involved in cell wall biosynthesis
LYPGIRTANYCIGPKEPLILSIGRFAPYGNHKQHETLINAFRALTAECPGWSLHVAGSLKENEAASCEYFTRLREQASHLPVVFHPNLEIDSIRQLLSRASLYWHSAGWGLDGVKYPDRVEQFGISIVEALASGAVPLVYGAGGVTEIVQNTINGIVWRTIPELVSKTKQLTPSSGSLDRMRQRGREAAEFFSDSNLNAAIEGLLPIGFNKKTVPT